MKTQWFTLLVFLILAGAVLTACEDTGLSSSDPNVSGVQAHATLEFAHAVQTSTAQAQYAAQWRATVQAAATQDTLKAAYVAAQTTSESIRAAAAATQTQQVWSATATAASNQATSTAADKATAQSWASTATQAIWNRQATSDASSLQAMQTAQVAQAEMAQLAAERQRTINTVQAAAPWVILAIAVPLAAYLAWIWGRTETLRRRAIPRDPRGDAPILILDDGGRRNVIDPDLFFGAVVSIPRHGQPEAPILVPHELQMQVKARDQAVDLVNRGLAGQVQKRRALPALSAAHPNLPLANVRVVDAAEVKDWLPDVLPDIHRQALAEGEVKMIETDNYISRRYQVQAQAIANRLPKVLQQRGLAAPFSEFLLTSVQGVVLLLAILDVQHVQRLEAYIAPELLHHLSTDLQGYPVFLSNSSGLRYAIPLSPLPRLPKLVAFPGVENGRVLFGVSHAGEIIHLPWSKLGHMLVAGKTGSGKSVFLRLLAYQAIAAGAQLLLVDLDGATFPMLSGHPALISPIAASPEAAQASLERAIGECENRSALYLQMDGYPENLEEYNDSAVRQGKQPLSRLLIVLDEFSALMTTLGGPKSTFANQVTELGWRGRKFGIHLVFAAQDFTKQVVGRVRDQVNEVVCFRVRSPEAARAVGCPDAVHIPENRPGLAYTDRWGLVQTFYLEKRLFTQAGTQTGINPQAVQLAQRAIQEAGGRMSIPLLVSWGLPERGARSLVERWELRGWLRQDPARQNARYITSEFQDLLSNRQDRQAGSNRSS